MSDLESKIEELKKMNSDLALVVQDWKMIAAQREKEKLELMKELNDTRLKLNRLINVGSAEARKLDIALQASSEEALRLLVGASNTFAKTMSMTKAYLNSRQDLESNPPRWSTIGGTPATEKVHKVRPMLLDGRSLQPVVALRRAVLDTPNNNSSRSTNQRGNVAQRALPMHMLQDVYIPLTRIEVSNSWPNTMESRENEDDSTENLGLTDDSDESLEESRHSSDLEDNQASRRLDALPEEDMEAGDEVETLPLRNRVDNPLEGPSWLLDREPFDNERTIKSRATLEPDSTTEMEESPRPTVASNDIKQETRQEPRAVGSVSLVFTPTVRRKRSVAESPILIPAKKAWRCNRVLQVLVPKMKLDSPPEARRPEPRFDAPSPNGATDCRVIVSEAVCSSSRLGEPAKITSRNKGSKESSIRPVKIDPDDPDDSDRRQSDSPRNDRKPQHSTEIDSNETLKAGVSHNVSHDVSRDNDDSPNKISKRDNKVMRGIRNDETDNETSNNCNTKRNKRNESEPLNVSHMDRNDERNSSPSDSQAERNVSQRDRNVSQRDRNVSRRDRTVSRRDRTVSHRDRTVSHRDLNESQNSNRDSDSSESDIASNGRSRRQRKQVTYKEKPLNRKLRR